MNPPESPAADELAKREADFLREFLSNRDAPCPNCEYNLRGLTGAICPECGEPIVVHVALAEPKQAALITGLIGLSAGAGLNGLLIVYVLLVSLFRNISPPADEWRWFLWVNASGLVVMGLAMFVWLRCWRIIRKQSTGLRWSLAAVCWLLSLANVVVFSLSIR